jgi:DNA mismatch repair protein MutS2
MSRTAQEVLEFDKLRELLRLRTTCAPGRRAVNTLEPGTDRAALESAFALIREAREWLRAGRELGFGSLADPQGWLERIEGPGAVLEPRQFLDAGSLLETAGWLRQQFREEAAKFPLLAARAVSLGDFRDLHAAIRRCVLPNGEISDDASAALRRIRVSVAQTRESIQKTLKQILRARNAEAGEDYVTLRNERFVIPVRAEHRRSVPGVVHGASATGQTVFMEPFETVEANNQLVQLAEDEAAEIVRILRELTEGLQRVRGPLLAAAETIAELDSVFARARFAQEFDAAMPEFSETNELRLEGARHPVLEDKLRKENRSIVPITLALGGEERVLVISGPNTGGKTVALKTTGMAALAAQSGIPVAAQRAVLPLFDRVLVDIGDEQSIAADLSTFRRTC